MRLWLTRSEPGASRQAGELEAAGHHVVCRPAIAIERLEATPPQGPFDWVFFLSEHAVRSSASLDFCEGARVMAVGERTAAVLAERGVPATVASPASTEGLLALALAEPPGSLPQLSALIVAGEDGRETLAEALAERGVRVCWYHCYRRRPVARLVAPDRVDVLLAASVQGLRVAAAAWFDGQGGADVAVLASSRRIAEEARRLGFRRVLACAGADTRAILAGVSELQAEPK